MQRPAILHSDCKHDFCQQNILKSYTIRQSKVKRKIEPQGLYFASKWLWVVLTKDQFTGINLIRLI